MSVIKRSTKRWTCVPKCLISLWKYLELNLYIITVVDPKTPWGYSTPFITISFIFMQFLAKILKDNRLAPPQLVSPPPQSGKSCHWIMCACTTAVIKGCLQFPLHPIKLSLERYSMDSDKKREYNSVPSAVISSYVCFQSVHKEQRNTNERSTVKTGFKNRSKAESLINTWIATNAWIYEIWLYRR